MELGGGIVFEFSLKESDTGYEWMRVRFPSFFFKYLSLTELNPTLQPLGCAEPFLLGAIFA